MPDDPQDPPRRGGSELPPNARQASPTVKSFPAVHPAELPPDSRPPSVGEADVSPAGPTHRGLTLAVMRLAEEVERLGGDVSEVRYLLGMDERRR